jgi:hypothetical protein
MPDKKKMMMKMMMKMMRRIFTTYLLNPLIGVERLNCLVNL